VSDRTSAGPEARNAGTGCGRLRRVDRGDRVKRGQVGDTAEVLPEAPVGGSYQAKVAVVDQVFEAASGTIGVRLELANPDLRLPAGIHCRVHFGGLS
jgi:hypothetical protein